MSWQCAHKFVAHTNSLRDHRLSGSKDSRKKALCTFAAVGRTWRAAFRGLSGCMAQEYSYGRTLELGVRCLEACNYSREYQGSRTMVIRHCTCDQGMLSTQLGVRCKKLTS